MRQRRRLTAAVVVLVGCLIWSLLAGTGGVSDAAVVRGPLERVSVVDDNGGAGLQAPDSSLHSQVSGDGRSVVFVSQDNLDPNFNNGCCNDEVYVRDRATGRTMQISVGTNGGQDGPNGKTVYKPNGYAANDGARNGSSDYPSISADGRFVSFVTQAKNIAGGPGTHDQLGDQVPDDSLLVVCDRGAPPDEPRSGIDPSNTPTTATTDPPPNTVYDYVCIPVRSIAHDIGLDGWPRLSATGNRITWAEQEQSTVVTGEQSDTTIQNQVLTADLRGPDGTGPLTPPDGVAPFPSDVVVSEQTDQPAISADGTTVVARRRSVHLPDDSADSGRTEYAIVSAQVGPGTADAPAKRVDAATTRGRFIGTADVQVAHPTVSGNGRRVAFDATDESGGNTGYFTKPQVYAVLDTAPSRRVSTVVSQAYVGPSDDGDGEYASLSADGNYIAFVSDKIAVDEGRAPTPVYRSCTGGDDDNNPPNRTFCQIVVRDLTVDNARATATPPRPLLPAQLASVSIKRDCASDLGPDEVCVGSNQSYLPSLSRDGAVVAFESDANDLVPGDTNTVATEGEGTTNPARDVFVREWTTTLTAIGVDFGTVKTGSSTDRSVTVTAGGFGPVKVGSIRVTGTDRGDFQVVSSTCSGVTLLETQTCTVTVRFTPSATGTRTGRIDVFADGNTTKPKTVIDVTGTGSTTPPRNPDIALDPPVVDFGSDLPLHLPGKVRQLTVTDPGGSPLHVSAATVTDGAVPGASTDFTVDLGTCAAPVPAGGTCRITITFIGSKVGPRPAVLTITSTAPGVTNVIPLRAVVPAPKVTVNPAVTPDGRVTTVSGTGFAPNRAIGVGFTATSETARARTDAKGAFRVGLVIFQGNDQGPRTVIAHVDGADASLRGQAPLLLVLGSLESPTLVLRH